MKATVGLPEQALLSGHGQLSCPMVPNKGNRSAVQVPCGCFNARIAPDQAQEVDQRPTQELFQFQQFSRALACLMPVTAGSTSPSTSSSPVENVFSVMSRHLQGEPINSPGRQR